MSTCKLLGLDARLGHLAHVGFLLQRVLLGLGLRLLSFLSPYLSEVALHQ